MLFPADFAGPAELYDGEICEIRLRQGLVGHVCGKEIFKDLIILNMCYYKQDKAQGVVQSGRGVEWVD